MALTGPYYWNGTTFPIQSGKPVLIGQAEFENCCDPCESCAGAQGNVVVTVTPGCGGGCDMSGTYLWTGFTPGSPCIWRWDLPGFLGYLQLYYGGAGQWCAAIIGHFPTCPYGCGTPPCPFGGGWRGAVTGSISCSGGQLGGVFYIQGTLPCSGCVATVTL